MSDTSLAAVPALGPLFAKAVLARKKSGKALSDKRLTVAEQPIDALRLASYQQLCGYRVADQLPPTYLHLMSFPLSVALMVDNDFPFPLLGLVHVNNSVTQLRPVELGERVSVSAWASDLGAHPAGRQVDLRSEARIDGELVWHESSTYLHREQSADRPKPERTSSGDRPSAVIQWSAPADIGRRYGAISGDRNPIHLHNLSAKAFGFRSAIAHGMWLKARTLAVFEGRLPAAFSAEVAFKTPVFLPSKLALAASTDGKNWQLEVHNARSGKPHLLGTISG